MECAYAHDQARISKVTPQMGYYAKVSDKPSRYMITPMLKCVTPDNTL